MITGDKSIGKDDVEIFISESNCLNLNKNVPEEEPVEYQ